MSGIRDTYPTWASVPAHIQRAVNAYDDARRQDSPWEWAMSERNKTSIAPMIEAAIEAAKPPPGADSGLAAADDNPRDVPRDEEGRDAYQIIADGNRQAMLRRAGVKDRSREPLLGPPSDMLVSRILLEALPDVDPKRADQLAVKINDALPADDNHKALVEALTDQLARSLPTMASTTPAIGLSKSAMMFDPTGYAVRGPKTYTRSPSNPVRRGSDA